VYSSFEHNGSDDEMYINIIIMMEIKANITPRVIKVVEIAFDKLFM
jgi:hypothetical protein